MHRQFWTRFVAALPVVCSITAASPVFGQPSVSRSALTVGATAGIASAGQTERGGGRGPVFAGHVEVPIAGTYMIRLSGGTMRWTPTNDVLGIPPEAGRIALDHVTAVVMRHYIEQTVENPVGFYAGVGGGYYRYRIQNGLVGNPDSIGLQVILGVEHRKIESDTGVRLEVQMNAAKGPLHRDLWARSVPTISVSAGISRRF